MQDQYCLKGSGEILRQQAVQEKEPTREKRRSGIAGAAIISLSIIVAACIIAAAIMSSASEPVSADAVTIAPEIYASSTNAGDQYVGSVNSSVVHRSGCPYAERIDAENLTIYTSLESALEDGREPCSSCFSKASSFDEWTILDKYGFGG